MDMSFEEKVRTVKELVDHDENATEQTVSVYLHLSEQKILDRLYPMDSSKRAESVPDKYALLQCELAARLYLRKGAEGEASHEENGINRTYGSVDDEDILSRLTPYAVVI